MANLKQTLRERSVSFENQLIENNLGLVRYIARRYQSTQYSMESLFSVGAAGLVKAARTYRSERDVLFSTYAGRCITNEILMYLRRNRKHQKTLSLDAPLTDFDSDSTATLADLLGAQDDELENGLEKDEEKQSLLAAVSRLSPRSRALISMRYGLGGQRHMRQSEVARKLGISQSYVSRIEKQTLCHLRKMLA